MSRNNNANIPQVTIDFFRVFALSPMPQLITDAAGHIVYANDAACTLLGYTVDTLTQHDIQSLLDTSEEETAYADLMLYPHMTVEQRYQAQDGVWIDCKATIYPLTDEAEDTRYYVTALEDIRERKRRDEMLQTATHDLKNPLTNVRSAASLLKEVIGDDAEGVSILDVIQKATDSMFALINGLLDLSRLEGRRLQPEWVPLNAFLSGLLEDFSLVAEKKAITLRFIPLEPDVTLAFDPSLMRQAINNLVSNALKYTPEGGNVELSGLVTADEIIIQVIDNGIGIPKGEIPHLFNRFYRVATSEHLAQDGTGLGLSLIKAIIEQHDGRIWVESELKQGSTFYIALPLEEDD